MFFFVESLISATEAFCFRRLRFIGRVLLIPTLRSQPAGAVALIHVYTVSVYSEPVNTYRSISCTPGSGVQAARLADLSDWRGEEVEKTFDMA